MNTLNSYIKKGDCLELMKEIPDGSVDLILCDLPYGVTACKWDEAIPFDLLWPEYERVCKSNGIIVLFGTEPFSSKCRMSNIKRYKYDWVWDKISCSNPQLAKIQPLKIHENIMVFYSSDIMNDTTLFFQKSKDYMIAEKEKAEAAGFNMRNVLGNYMGSHYFTRKTQFAFPKYEDYQKLQSTGFFKREYDDAKRVTYNPQGLKRISKTKKVMSGVSETEQLRHIQRKVGYVQEWTGYPKSIIEYPRPNDNYHPTQKPTALLEYLIKTYTNPGELVLDNCMGSGSTCVAAKNTGRRYIGFELDPEYFEIAKNRISCA